MSETEKPRRKSGLTCPLRGGKDVSKVCHICEFFNPVDGVHPQTGERISKWMCDVRTLLLIGMDSARQRSETTAAVQSLRNEVADDQERSTRILASALLHSAPALNGSLIDNGVVANQVQQIGDHRHDGGEH